MISLQMEGEIRSQTPALGRGELAKDIVPRRNGLGQGVVSRFVQGEGQRLLQGCFSFRILTHPKYGKESAYLALHGEQPRVRVDQHGRLIFLSLRNGHGDGCFLNQIALGHGIHYGAQGYIRRGGQRQRFRAALGIGRNRSQQGIAGPHLKIPSQGFGQPLAFRRGPQPVERYRQGGLVRHGDR